MGLSAPKRRNKISHDPNNTTWSKSANTYGQKILAAQGWKPGDYLGAENPSHADHYTAANASHIRVLLREENLGLGAQVGKANAETFGLSLFSGVLGRLNGKSDAELDRQQNALRDAELRTYQSNKYGFMNFVSGGVLVGDMIKPAESERSGTETKESSKAEDYDRRHKVKKRKEGDDATTSEPSKSSKFEHDRDELRAVEKKSKRRQRREQRSSQINSDEDHDTDVPQNWNVDKGSSTGLQSAEFDSSDKKAEKKRRKAPRDEDKQEHSQSSTKSDITRSKHERRARKAERRKRKEEKRRSKLSKEVSVTETTSSEQSPGDETSQSENTKTPALLLQGNRHAVRHRYIQQKRMTSLNPQAMREIFMLKAMA